MGYWLFSLNSSGNNYNQTVAGLNSDIVYSGESQSNSISVSRNVFRSATAKTRIELGVLTRQSKNFIDDVEVEVQRRNTTFWTLAVDHRHYIGDATLTVGLEYLHGTRDFGADPAPEEDVGTGTALSRIIRPDLHLIIPFELNEQAMRFQSRFQGQWTDDRLTAQDQFSIGGRYNVRGFDGQTTLAADRGWFLRNELGWLIPDTQNELYIGVDTGEVSGNNSEFLLGRSLAGGVIGLRGNFRQLSYDLFASTDLAKPDGFQNDTMVYGFNLHWEY